MARNIRRCSRSSRFRNIHWVSGVKARDVGIVKARRIDVDYVRTGIKDLVLGRVEICGVPDLNGRVGAGDGAGGRIRYVVARVARVDFSNGSGEEGISEVRLGLGVCLMVLG